jgi:hypothetical protein
MKNTTKDKFQNYWMHARFAKPYKSKLRSKINWKKEDSHELPSKTYE